MTYIGQPTERYAQVQERCIVTVPLTDAEDVVASNSGWTVRPVSVISQWASTNGSPWARFDVALTCVRVLKSGKLGVSVELRWPRPEWLDSLSTAHPPSNPPRLAAGVPS